VQGQQASSRGELGDKLQKRDAGGAGLFETVAGADPNVQVVRILGGFGEEMQRSDMMQSRALSRSLDKVEQELSGPGVAFLV
jgi:hypothetical protein